MNFFFIYFLKYCSINRSLLCMENSEQRKNKTNNLQLYIYIYIYMFSFLSVRHYFHSCCIHDNYIQAHSYVFMYVNISYSFFFVCKGFENKTSVDFFFFLLLLLLCCRVISSFISFLVELIMYKTKIEILLLL